MAQKVNVSVEMKQNMEGEIDVTKLTTKGELYEVNGKFFLSYEETIDGMDAPIMTMVKIAEDKVVVQRKGAMVHKMEFCPGKQTRCNYHTPMGIMILDIRTKELLTKQTEDAMILEIEYEMDMNEEFVSKNSLSLVIH